MKKKKDKKETVQYEVVESLLKHRVNSLEEKVKELDSGIKKRLDLNVHVLGNLGTKGLRIKGKLKRLRYRNTTTSEISHISHLEIELAKIEVQKNSEMLDCFREVFKMREQLQESRQELVKERLKLKLLE